MIMLQVNHLRKQYADKEVIKDIDFQINQDECAALLGPNGAGKTTIIKMLLGITKPSGGEILFEGHRQDKIRHFIGYLPQHPTFYPWMTGKELLAFMGGLSGIDKPALSHRMSEMLELVGLSKDGDKRIVTYSGGMKQRLGIAQALIHEPKLLIMDEPVSALDPLGRRDMLELLKMIKKQTTILFSTHILHDAEELCNKIFILNQGQLLVNGSIDQILLQNQQPIFIIQAPHANEWAPQLVNPAVVESITQNENLVKVRVNHIDQGRSWLLDTIHRLKLPIQKFELVQESLEDIFMRMVK
ncbi:ABC transporter ATP-binding protein [Paenibacillus nasutitermitis]|uniref:ABC transporter ATP-binding protein YxlF n=1 Tax=Paenibacillus nasutitermitis TaxID=1652958 RepID=A0A917DYT2_9BACL|nr:ABC transporter ATP-binding protein [Paenibacillus nasutitermitis]GGD84719.1 putative ABC transporter ATP-binding protein YxlF [Paenibacillus nasutitermitis]